MRRADGLRFWRMAGLVRIGLVLCLGCCSWATAPAQYEESPEYSPSVARFLLAGLMLSDFAPLGSNPGAASTAVAYDGLMPMIGLRQGPVDITIGYTRYTLRGTSQNAVVLRTSVTFDLPIAGKRPSVLLLPVVITGDYTKASSDGPSRSDFNVGSLGAGIGLKFRYFRDAVDLSVQISQGVHYSFEGFGTLNGYSAASIGEIVLLLPRVLVLDGIAVGYRFRYQTWSMSDKAFNYRFLSHGPFLGVIL